MTLQETTTVVLAAIGVIFMLISAVGLVRLPDVFSRMHAAGKATTVGVSCLLLGAGVYFWNDNLLLRAVVLIALIFATSPISTSAMARAAYRTGSTRPLHLRVDEMQEETIDPSDVANHTS
ncbi:MAG: monovalent cation/H(+) antiporter subunit G [Anaerolineales bacterium]|nr:monovalent cation/H(+) antiporter subunit G [Anaerolineales bacterium]